MQIRSATFQLSAPNLASCPSEDLPEFAFIGRSNVGKSSLLNLLAGQTGGKPLARTSPVPGHTKLINFFVIDHKWRLVDLPGYGFAKTSKTQRDQFQQMIAEYLTQRENLACVFVLIDSRHPPQQIDLEFLQWLMQAGAPCALVFTKTDLSKPSKVKTNIELFDEQIASWGWESPNVFTCSAETRAGRTELLQFIQQTLASI